MVCRFAGIEQFRIAVRRGIVIGGEPHGRKVETMPVTENEVTASRTKKRADRSILGGRLGVGRTYLFRRQRKAILENCRRIAVVGASADPNSPSFVSIEKLLGMGLEIIPVFPGRESLLGLRCYAKLTTYPASSTSCRSTRAMVSITKSWPVKRWLRTSTLSGWSPDWRRRNRSKYPDEWSCPFSGIRKFRDGISQTCANGHERDATTQG